MNPSAVEQLLELAGKAEPLLKEARRNRGHGKYRVNGRRVVIETGDSGLTPVDDLRFLVDAANFVRFELAAVDLVEPLARDWQRMREAIRAYIVAIGRAPNNRDEDEIDRASRALLAAIGMPGVAAPSSSPVQGWVEHICAHSHRWRSEDKSTRCPVCGTSTFKDVALAAVSGEEAPAAGSVESFVPRPTKEEA